MARYFNLFRKSGLWHLSAVLWLVGVSFGASTYYVDCSGGSGSDSNNGTAKGTPFLHIPGGALCSGNCTTAYNGITSGTQIILKGNTVCPNSFLGVLMDKSGTSGNSVYYGVDQTWFINIAGTANTDSTGKIVTWVSGVHSLGDFSSALIGNSFTVNSQTCNVTSTSAATWNLNGTMATAPTATCSASVGANLTGTAFSIALWGRPILNAGGSLMGSGAGVANVMVRPYGNYITIDNWELQGLFWTGTPAAGTAAFLEFAGGTPGQGTNDEIKNVLIHGWSHDVRTSPTCTTESNLILGDTGVPNNNVNSSVHDSIITGVDVNNSSGTSGAAFFGGPASMYRDWAEYVSDGGVINGTTTVHDTSVFNVGPTFQISNTCGGVAHTNGWEFNAQSTNYTFYNNVLAHLGTGTLGLWTATNSGVTVYAFNNVIFDTDTGNILDPAQSVANNGCPQGATYCTAAGTTLYYNDTVECGPDSGPPSATCIGSNSGTGAATTGENTYFITSASPIYSTPPTPTLTTNLTQTKTVANGNGQTAVQTYAFSPTTGSLGSGTSLSGFCTAVSGVDSTAGTACLRDTTYGVAIDRTNYTVTGPARTTNARNATPNIGAYEYSAPSTYTITISSIIGSGTVTSSDSVLNCSNTTPPPCTDTTASGTVTLTETPAGGYTFAGWGGGTCSGTASTCAVTTTATVTATFTSNSVVSAPSFLLRN